MAQYGQDLGGRTVLVTGASAGLGATFARALGDAGANVVLAARRVDRLEVLRDAQRAYALGLVNRLVATGAVLDVALALAATIAANAPVSLVESLKVARVATDLAEAELVTLSRAATRLVMRTEDAREGPRAFVERRPPAWQGR